jgi:hypothetical protein
MHTREWISAASKKLALDAELRLVGPHRLQAILERIVAERTTLAKDGTSALWWWGALRPPVSYSTPADALTLIRRLMPSEEQVWFVAEDGSKKIGNFWLYEGTVAAACSVLQECPSFEYYLVAKKMDWLICENHHGQVFASGEPVAGSLGAA